MSLIDKSPGAFIAAVNGILYTTVLLETWMLTTSSVAVMGLFMVLIIVLAGLLCRYAMNLMGSEDESAGHAPAVVAPAATPRRHAAPAPSQAGAPVLS